MAFSLIYISTSRFPTEKVSIGQTTLKMCEAYSTEGCDVQLWYPKRLQLNPELRDSNLFEYHGIRPSFAVRALPNFDVFRLERFVPSAVFMWLVLLHSMLWGLSAAVIARFVGAQVHVTQDTSIAFWLVLLRLPTVYESHDAVPLRARRALLKLIAHRASLRRVVALTPHIRERLVQLGVPAIKIAVLPNGVDLALFERTGDRLRCREELALPIDRPIIGYVGRYVFMGQEKGIPELIQAMGEVKGSTTLPSLLVCVGGPEACVEQYRTLANAAGLASDDVLFVNQVRSQDVPKWIGCLDIAAIPYPDSQDYAYYVSPLKLFEYMAAGATIVASDLPSTRSFLHHEDNSLLVEAGNPSDLARAILRLLKDRRLARALGQRALADSRSHSWEARAKEVLAILNPR
jgi:glycosyltransferase involved in cell wall biosynthesis